MKKQSFAVRVVVGSLCAFVTLMSFTAHAQTTYTWDGGGGDNNWSTGANWVGDVAPVRGSSTFVTFTGSTRTSPFNNQGDWQQLAGMTFASGASGFRIVGNNIGFVNGSGEQVITQNSATTQEINTTFSFSPNQNSRINLNAGDLLISSDNVYQDVTSAVARQIYIDGTDGTRRTVTFSGNVRNSGSGQDADLVILANKRVLVTGTLLNGNNNDTSVFVNNGVLQFSGAGTMTGGAAVIGDTSGSANAALRLDTAGSTFARQIEIRGGSSGQRIVGGLNTSGTVTFSGNVVATNSPSDYDLKAASGGAANFSGTRNFNAGLRVNRADADGTYGGTVILSGTTNSTSWTALHAGTLQFDNFNQLGTDSFEFNADSGDSGTLFYTGGSTTTTKTLWTDNTGITRAAIDVSQAGTTLTWNPGGGTRNQNLTKTGAGWLFFGGGISGGTVGVEGGLLVLSASNSYSGGTVVSGGALEVSAGGSQGGSEAALGTGTVSIASGAQVKYWLSLSGSHTITNAFSLSGGTLHTTDGANTYSGRVTFASGSSTISAQYEDVITVSGGLAGSGNVLFTQAGGTGSYAAPTYVLSGTGANTGTVRVTGSSGGAATKLQLASVDALQTATLDLATGDVGTVEFTVAGNNTYALGGLQGSRDLAFGANSLSIGGNGQSTTYAGNLSGSGSLTKTGNGTLTLSGSNSYGGGTIVSAGSVIGTTSSLQGAITNNAAVTFAQSTAGTYAGVMSGSGSVTKTGAGVLQFTAANTYTGLTSVIDGGLRLNGSIAGGLNVALVASLSGTGTVGGNATIIGTHSPGNSPGVQTFNGNLTYQAGAIVNWELIANTTGSAGTNYDQIIVPTGNLDFAGSTTLALSFSGTGSTVDWTNAFWNVNRSWTVYDLSGGTTTNIGNLVLGGSLLDSLGNSLSPTGRGYFTTSLSGQDVMLNFVSVPEPSTWAMALASVACGGFIRWRKRARLAVALSPAPSSSFGRAG